MSAMIPAPSDREIMDRPLRAVTPFRCACCGLTGYRGSCAACSREFTARNSTALYCSTRCRVEAHRHALTTTTP